MPDYVNYICPQFSQNLARALPHYLALTKALSVATTLEAGLSRWTRSPTVTPIGPENQ